VRIGIIEYDDCAVEADIIMLLHVLYLEHAVPFPEPASRARVRSRPWLLYLSLHHPDPLVATYVRDLAIVTLRLPSSMLS